MLPKGNLKYLHLWEIAGYKGKPVHVSTFTLRKLHVRASGPKVALDP